MLNQIRLFISAHSPDWLNSVNSQQSTVNSEQPKLMTDDCLLNTVKGRPHWRRIKQVFEVLELAGTGTYTELVNYVREVTGIG